MHFPIDRITHSTTFVTPVVEHWLEREIVLLIRMCNFHICFCSFDQSYFVLEEDNFIKNVYIVLSCSFF